MSADEFDIIAKHFAPLAKDEAARGLMDDAAVLAAQGRVVVTTDTIVEGVHFLPDDPIHLVAKKALRVNLSDLAAKGAQPIGVLLSLAWPDEKPASDIARFAEGLKEDIERYSAPLIGGDTTATSGPLTVMVTAIGNPLGARVPARADAQVGDDLWVTGVIGDAFLGLKARREQLHGLDADAVTMLALRYQLPDPPMAFAGVVARCANASMDVSDGLIGDAAKLAAASNLALRIEAARVPLSDQALLWLARAGEGGRVDLFSGGDDYQVLFTAAPARRPEIEAAGQELGIRVTRIGVAEAGSGVVALDANGKALPRPLGGHRHRLGR